MKKAAICLFGGYLPEWWRNPQNTQPHDLSQNLRRKAKRTGQPLRLFRAVLQRTSPRQTPAEVFPVLVSRRHLRCLLRGADWLRSRTPLQPQSAGRYCICREAVHHQTRQRPLKASETPLIPRFLLRTVTCSSTAWKVAQTRNLGL